MCALPIVAICGRPNVGKSTLFNRLVGSRVSIEESTSGVTRDIITAHVTFEDRTFELFDTGGIGTTDRVDLADLVEDQINTAVAAAQVIVLVVDIRDGVTAMDKEAGRRLREAGKTDIILVANKAETRELEANAADFYSLGFGEPLAVSAKEGIGKTDLLAAIAEKLPPTPPMEDLGPIEQPMRFAIVGKQNVGKSSFVNSLAGVERMIVSEIPGTTRDAVDVIFEFEGERFVAIDTAGLRKKGKLENGIEFYSRVRSEQAIERADVCLLILDCTKKISKVDKQIGAAIANAFKPCVIVANKWDLAGEIEPEKYDEYVRDQMPGLAKAPMICACALDGGLVMESIEVALDLYKAAGTRAGTGELNRVIDEALRAHRPRVKANIMPRIYFATQVQIHPPTVVFFCNKPKFFNQQYRRYLSNFMSETFGWEEIPIQMFFRERKNIFTGEDNRPLGGTKSKGRASSKPKPTGK